MNRNALVIGINKYPFLTQELAGKQKYQHLKTPGVDAEAMAKVLEKPSGDLGWDVKRLPEVIKENKFKVALEETVSEDELKKAISEILYPEAQFVPDVVLLFFAGHGLRKKYEDGQTEGFLATSDVNLRKNKWGVSLHWLRQQLKNSPVKQQIIWLDCCHSGELFNFLTEDELKNWFVDGDRCLITACRSERTALGVGNHGVLTEVLLQALDQEQQPEGEWISSQTVTDFIQQQLTKNPLLKRQIPLCRNFGKEIRFWQGTKRSPKKDWGDAPDVSIFFGRTEEIATLEQWIVRDKCRLVAILGMGGVGKTKLSIKLGQGGIGKTDLSLKVAQGIEEKFDYIIWRSLLNAPKLKDILTDLIKFLSNKGEIPLLDGIDDKISLLLHYLTVHRCLLILDNVETILKSGERAGKYKEGYEEYNDFFQKIIENPHQSCLLLTSREKPYKIQFGKNKPARFIKLEGLQYSDAQKIFEAIGNFVASDDEWKEITELYNGNPLALELAANYIHEVFNGKINNFLTSDKFVFQELRDLLYWHFNRLSIEEKNIMYWLVINREPVSISELKSDILSLVQQEKLLDNIQSLQGRITVEISHAGFTLQPVLIEYITDLFIEIITSEINSKKINIFNSHVLMKATASDYLREMQIRMLVIPVIDKLLDIFKSKSKIENQFLQIITDLRNNSEISHYAAGNILNLLIKMSNSLGNKPELLDFSHLIIRQAYLQGVNLYDIDFSYSNLINCVFAETLGSVFSVAFSKNVKLMAVGDANGQIHLWEIKNNQKNATFTGDISWVWSLTFSPNGETLATGSDDHTVRIWDIKTGEYTTLGEHDKSVRSVAYTPDSKYLASSSDDTTIRVWDIKTGEYETLTGHTNSVWCVTFSPDGKLLASGSDDTTIRFWVRNTDTNQWEESQKFDGHNMSVRSIAFSSDGSKLASGSQDSTVRLWDVNAGQCTILEKEKGHTDWVWSVAFSPKDDILVSSGEDQSIKLWDVKTGKCFDTLQEHNHSVRAIAFSSDGKAIISGSYDQTVKFWQRHNITQKWQCLKTWQGLASQVRSVTFSSEDKILASCSGDKTVRLWRMNISTCQYEEWKKLEGHADWVWSVAFSPDGKNLASSSDDKTVRVWDIYKGTYQVLNNRSRVRSVKFSPDGKTLACGCNNCKVVLWRQNIRTKKWEQKKVLSGHTNWIWSVAFNSDGTILSSSSEDRTIKLWDVNTCKLINTFTGHTGMVYSVAFSSDSRILASGSGDHSIKLWDVVTGKCLKTLQGHTRWVWSVNFSAGGKILASGSGDNTIKLWNISDINRAYSQQTLDGIDGHSNWVRSVAFNPEGTILASGGDDETIKLWDTQTGRYLTTLKAKGPYAGMNITGVKSLTEAEKDTLLMLGAFEL